MGGFAQGFKISMFCVVNIEKVLGFDNLSLGLYMYNLVPTYGNNFHNTTVIYYTLYNLLTLSFDI
ncbi:MAG: hypothetical protein DRH15_09660 [Deltaproteobacteria bacterium]|nr:MAG: hypothetical protein DRH15_09660 [Deltaproteobacteria bacterium]